LQSKTSLYSEAFKRRRFLVKAWLGTGP
jgi:hypothetical protein